jgi:hypothetical protein
LSESTLERAASLTSIDPGGGPWKFNEPLTTRQAVPDVTPQGLKSETEKGWDEPVATSSWMVEATLWEDRASGYDAPFDET